ncbi:MAG TPA: FAD-dependent oxidoreductase [Bryobacteraceae bacterium]|jgi:thioredoxin reductase (NADPH)
MASGAESQSRSTPAIKICGKVGCPQAYAIRDFLHRNDVPFHWIELRTEEQCRALGIDALGDEGAFVCVFPDETRLEKPTVRQIVEKLGWLHNPSLSEYDLAIFGAGPAGLSAAVYGASEGLKTVLVERWAVGGQAGSSPKIENYLGFPNGVSGADLAERAREQACRFGAEILLACEGVRGEFTTGKRVGYLADGTKISARAAICATGIDYSHLGLPNEGKFHGAGLYYGAGAREAELCGNEHVFIAGGGNSAGQASIHFARFARKVTIVVRGDSLKATLSQYLIDRITSTSNIEVLTNSDATALHGDKILEAVTLKNRLTSQEQTRKTKWLFVCIGGAPRTDWAVEAGVVRDEAGYLVTGPDLLLECKRPNGWPLNRGPYYLETNVPGLFAAGDVRHGSVKRCASAVGEGAMSVMFVHRYLAEG